MDENRITSLEFNSRFSGGFTGARLDRADQLRSNPQALDQARRNPQARCLRLSGIDFLPGDDGGLAWDAAALIDPERLILLGFDGADIPHFVAEPHSDEKIDGRSRTALRMLPMLSASEAAVYGGARSLVDWHAHHRFCSVCGAPSLLHRAGWGRKCSVCSAAHFPRVDPVVIMLAEFKGQVLIGRQALFPPQFYSALAGFVEPGESLEEAVARELHEEAGIKTKKVDYIASQPWPFPSSLMIGCIAQVRDCVLTLDTTEIEDAMWVDRNAIRDALEGKESATFMAPPALAIAHHLLKYWLESRT